MKRLVDDEESREQEGPANKKEKRDESIVLDLTDDDKEETRPSKIPAITHDIVTTTATDDIKFEQQRQQQQQQLLTLQEEMDEELDREIAAIINAGCQEQIKNNTNDKGVDGAAVQTPPSIVVTPPTNEEPPLSPSQQRAFESVMHGQNVFITGNAGSGKSFLIKRIIKALSERRRRGVLTASTGIASWNIGGVTAHSFAGMGLADKDIKVYTSNMKYKPDKVKEWKELDVLIIDECSMLGVDFFGKLDAMARFTRGSELPFGGLQVILIGDYFQLPSVEKDFEEFDDDGNRRPRYLFQMPLWKTAQFQSIALRENFRQQSDPTFFQLLERVKVSKTTEEDQALLETRLIERHPLTNPADLIKLCPRRATAQAINQEELDKIKGEARKFTGVLVEYNERGLPQPQKQQEGENKNKPEQYPVDVTLTLKAGAEVLLCVNMATQNLFNGSRGTVVDFRKDDYGGAIDKTTLYPYVKFETGQSLLIRPNTWEKNRRGRLVSTFTQVPLILRYAVTIHKAQGLTLGKVLVTGRSFEHGQDYVALSRVQKLSDLYLQAVDMSTITTSQAVIDFYTEEGLL